VQRTLTAIVARGGTADLEVRVAALAEERAVHLQAYRALLAEITMDERPTLAALMIAVRELEGVTR
jgi:NAD-specific glutamate dehydrogenase